MDEGPLIEFTFLLCAMAIFLPATLILALLQARRPEVGGQTGAKRLVYLLVLPVLCGFAVVVALTRTLCGDLTCIDKTRYHGFGLILPFGASFALAFALTAFAGYWLLRKLSWKAALLAPVLLGIEVLVFGVLFYTGRVFFYPG